MNTTYITRTNYSEEYFFTYDGVQYPEKAREEWEAVCSEATRKNSQAKQEREEYGKVVNNFNTFLKENGVSISTRRMNGLLEEVRKSKVRSVGGYSPRIIAQWVDWDGKITKVPWGYNKNISFDEAIEAVLKMRDKMLKDKLEAVSREKAAIEYCIENKLEWSPATAVDIATNHVGETEIAEAIANETVFNIDSCYECNKWTAGEHRCSCGNRRVNLTWDGIYPDVYIYPEAC